MCLLYCILCHKIILFLFYKEDCGEIFLLLLEVLFGALHFWREKRKTARAFLRFSFLSAAFTFFLLNVALTLFAAVLSQVCILFWGEGWGKQYCWERMMGILPVKFACLILHSLFAGNLQLFCLIFHLVRRSHFNCSVGPPCVECYVVFACFLFCFFFLSFSTCKRYVVNVVVLCFIEFSFVFFSESFFFLFLFTFCVYNSWVIVGGHARNSWVPKFVSVFFWVYMCLCGSDREFQLISFYFKGISLFRELRKWGKCCFFKKRPAFLYMYIFVGVFHTAYTVILIISCCFQNHIWFCFIKP